MSPHILIVEDNEDTLESTAELVELQGATATKAASLKTARERFQEEPVDGILLDLNLPDGSGLDWIAELRESGDDVAILAVTGDSDIPTAVKAMQQGADHFLTKPVEPDNLEIVLNRALEVRRMQRRESSRKRLSGGAAVFRGESSAAAEAWALAENAAENESPILITGETGTGKGVMARWIHDHGPRRDGEFVEINCSALGGDLLASELFGHRKGAFTSAMEDRAGLIEIADGGTLFLDEIGDMDLAVQAKFLKVIEEQRYRRLGETKVRKSDFRLICATNMDLAEAVRENRFREDLYYRICVFPIRVPPLRDRRDDLAELVRHQMGDLKTSAGRLGEAVLARLTQYSWPGNIRELRNVLERATLLARDGEILPEHLPVLDGSENALGTSDGPAAGDWSLERNEAVHLRAALDHFDGDVTRASEAVGVSRATFYRKLKKYGGFDADA